MAEIKISLPKNLKYRQDLKGWYLPSDNPIDEVINELIEIDEKDIFLPKLKIGIKKILSEIIADSSTKIDKNYCMRFKNVNAKIEDLMDIFPEPYDNISIIKFKIVTDWKDSHGKPFHLGLSPMRQDNGYIVLLYIILYALRRYQKKSEPHLNEICKICLLIIGTKLWNAESRKYVRVCDETKMKYVVSVMMNNNFYAHKYATPLELIDSAYIKNTKTSIPIKYLPNAFLDSSKSLQLIDDFWKRINQLFLSSNSYVFKSRLPEDEKGGSRGASSGIAPLYYKAIAQNQEITTSRSKKNIDDESESDISDSYSVNSFANAVDEIANNISMNTNPSYSKQFKAFLKDVKSIKEKRIDIVINSIHNIKYQDQVLEILENIFARLVGVSEEQVCQGTFYKTQIKRKIISSKHNPEVNKIKENCEIILQDVIKKEFGDDFSKWSLTQKSYYINMIIYVFAYNIQNHLCRIET